MTCLVDPDAAFLVGKAQELGIERTATDLPRCSTIPRSTA
jgi:hypothetical protein